MGKKKYIYIILTQTNKYANKYADSAANHQPFTAAEHGAAAGDNIQLTSGTLLRVKNWTTTSSGLFRTEFSDFSFLPSLLFHFNSKVHSLHPLCPAHLSMFSFSPPIFLLFVCFHLYFPQPTLERWSSLIYYTGAANTIELHGLPTLHHCSSLGKTLFLQKGCLLCIFELYPVDIKGFSLFLYNRIFQQIFPWPW